MAIKLSKEAKLVLLTTRRQDPEAKGRSIRLGLSPDGMHYSFTFSKRREQDVGFRLSEDCLLVIDRDVFDSHFKDTRIDWTNGPYGGGFAISDINQTVRCECGQVL